MAAATIEVEGARELRRTLAKAGADLDDLKTVHREVGAYVGARAVADAPKVSGRLAGSMRPSAAKASATIRFGSASIPYAGVIHWGWPGHNIAANPFASTAAEETEPTWLDMYMRRIEQIVAKVKGK
jgi:hypothetical protein